MIKHSAGILLYRNNLEVLLVHPGGPFWKGKECYSIPKGEVEPGEDKFNTAKRELFEETGIILVSETMFLGEFRQSNSKTIHIFAANQDFDPKDFVENWIDIEYPQGTGDYISIPEIDEAKWFDISDAKKVCHKGQIQVLNELEKKLK